MQYLRYFKISVLKRFGDSSFGTETTLADSTDKNSLRCTFKVVGADLTRPTTCDIRIYNTTQNTNNLMSAGDILKIDAGYESNHGEVFFGEILQTRDGRIDNIDTYLDIKAASAYPLVTAHTNRSYPSGTQASSVFKDVIDDISLRDGTGSSLLQLPENVSYIRGKSVFGVTVDELDLLNESYDTRFFIGLDNTYQLYGLESAFNEQTAIDISASSGMIGRPNLTLTGFQVKCLINPKFKVGGLIQLKESSINDLIIGSEFSKTNFNNIVPKFDTDGLYRIVMLGLEGDTRGNPWYHDLLVVDRNSARAIIGRAIAQERL